MIHAYFQKTKYNIQCSLIPKHKNFFNRHLALSREHILIGRRWEINRVAYTFAAYGFEFVWTAIGYIYWINDTLEIEHDVEWQKCYILTLSPLVPSAHVNINIYKTVFTWPNNMYCNTLVELGLCCCVIHVTILFFMLHIVLQFITY